MPIFQSGPIHEVPTNSTNVHAFRITGHLDDDASESLATHMNAIFDRQDSVNMLLDMTAFTGSDWDAMLDGDVISSRFRALSHVDRYAVVGAPDQAAKMIALFDKVIPVKAKAFEAKDSAAAWDFVGAKPVTT